MTKVKREDVEKVKKIYSDYKRAYKEQINKKIREDTTRARKHVKAKFEREDKVIKTFIANPTKETMRNVSNTIFGPNEGNRYHHIEKILDKFDKIWDRY